MQASFIRTGIVLRANGNAGESAATLNPACARLRDGTLQLYPRMVTSDNVSRIGSFRARELPDGTIEAEQCGYALEPEEPYEIRDGTAGHGCEDPRVTFVEAIDAYLMAYVAFGPPGPQVAAAISHDGLDWKRLGVLQFAGEDRACADKDAAFFPDLVLSPNGVKAIAFYHRPSLPFRETATRPDALAELESLPPEHREGIAIGYVSLDAMLADPRNVCNVRETHHLRLPPAQWGKLKVGCGTPPVRVREGWLSLIHGVDAADDDKTRLRYCAGLLLHDPHRVDRVLFRSPHPVFVPETPAEVQGTVADVVFPTGIDPRGERAFDIYYGMADDLVGRGRLKIGAAAAGKA